MIKKRVKSLQNRWFYTIVSFGYFEYYIIPFKNKVQEEGKIRHIAFSYHDDAEHLDQILAEHPEVEAVQIVVNYYDWDEPFIQAKKCCEVIAKHGAKVIAMEPVKGGIRQ